VDRVKAFPPSACERCIMRAATTRKPRLLEAAIDIADQVTGRRRPA